LVRVRFFLLHLVLVAALAATSGPTAAVALTPLPTTAAAVAPIVSAPVKPHVFTGDLRDLPKATAAATSAFVPDGPLFDPTGVEQRALDLPAAPSAPQPPTRAAGETGALEPAAAHAPAGFENPSVAFDGITFTGFRPPDTVGDVGPDHYVQMVNASFAIYDKTGTLLAGPSNINTLWSGFGGLCETTNRGDPIVLYDEAAGRFLVSQFAFNLGANNRPTAPFSQCVAISQTGDPVTGGFFLYEFATPNTMFPDYPKYGVWPDGYYFTTNQFGGTGGGGAYALDRAQMLNGNAATQVYFDTTERNMLPSDADGPTAPPAGAPNYFVKFVDDVVDRLEVREFDVDFANPALSTFTLTTTIPVAAFDSDPCGGFFQNEQCVPQPGTTQGLATLSDRLMWRLQYRNFGTHETLMANHSVDVDGTPLLGIRWYELRQDAMTPWNVFQSGTYSPDNTHRWMGSIAMDGEGNVALGYSVSSGTVFPGIRYVGRLAGDPAGTLPQGEITLMDGAGSQTACQSVDTDGDGIQDFCRGRWGDYSSMNVDPVDDCTFWYTTEYMPTGGNWRTHIASFSLCNSPPVADAGGPYTTDEGTDVTLDASGSSDPDGDAVTYEWDLDNDGAFDDATGATATFATVGQDGVFPVVVRVTDPDGASDTDETTVTVNNVAPSVSVATDVPRDEGDTLTLSGSATDPGWLDPLSATVDWGDGAGPQPLAGALENERPDATLTFSADHVYGDNGAFTITVCAADDDTSTCVDQVATIDNVAPTAAIDESRTTPINGVPTVLAHAGEPVDFAGRSTDPGSDDLTLTWDWDDGAPSPDVSTTSLVNPPLPDPPNSPSVQPRDVTDQQTHTFTDACAYDVVFAATDDDGGAASDTIAVLITGNAEDNRSAGYWTVQYRQGPASVFDTATLECYLAITGFASTVFDEARDASTIAAALDVLEVNGTSSAAELLDRQLLAVWLNFANGAMDLDTLVDTNRDGIADTVLSDALATAEAVRLDPAAPRSALLAQKNRLESINLMDQ
jgi:hypothetical protein